MTLYSSEKEWREKIQKEDELFFKNYFEKRGFLVKKLDEPGATQKPDQRKLPDFLVSKDDLKMCCEIYTMFEKEEISNSENDLRGISERIEELHFPYHFSFFVKNRTLLDKEEREPYVDSTLLRLSAKEEKNITQQFERKLSSRPYEPGEEIELFFKEKEFILKIEGKNEDGYMKKHSFHPPGYFLAPEEPKKRIHKRIHEKYEKFQTICESQGTPGILVIFGKNASLWEIEVFIACYKQPSLFQSNKNTLLSAVIYYDLPYQDKNLNFRPERFVVFHNPFAKFPLDIQFFEEQYNKQRVPVKSASDKSECEFEWIGYKE